MWLGCIGAVSGYCCKEVYIDFLIILLISTPLVLALFFAAASLLLCSFLKYLFVLVYIILTHY